MGMTIDNVIKIIVADDHPIIFEGIKSMVSDEANIKICDCVENLNLLDASIAYHLPDLLILDLNFAGKYSILKVPELKKICHTMKIIIFSSYDNDSVLREAVHYDVDGFVLKNTSKEEFVHAILTVMEGKTFFSKKIKRFKNYHQNTQITDFFDDTIKLSEREKEITRLVIDGLDSDSIAKQLHLSLHTVKTHRKNIFNKLHIHSVAELIKLVYSKNLL